MQRLTGGARIAITKHSVTKNSTQLSHCLFLAITQTASKTSALFSRIHLFLMMKVMRKMNPQCPRLQNRPMKNTLTPLYRLKQSCRSLHKANLMLPGWAYVLNNLAQGIFNAVTNVQIVLYH